MRSTSLASLNRFTEATSKQSGLPPASAVFCLLDEAFPVPNGNLYSHLHILSLSPPSPGPTPYDTVLRSSPLLCQQYYDLLLHTLFDTFCNASLIVNFHNFSSCSYINSNKSPFPIPLPSVAPSARQVPDHLGPILPVHCSLLLGIAGPHSALFLCFFSASLYLSVSAHTSLSSVCQGQHGLMEPVQLRFAPQL